MPRAQTHHQLSPSRLAVALAVLVGALAFTLVAGTPSSAQSDRLDSVRAEQEEIRSELAEHNAAVDDLLGQVGDLRERQRRVAAELAERETELAAARTDLVEARGTLAETRRTLAAALAALEDQLVSIYRYGEIDALTVLLDAEGYDDLLTRSVYLDHIRDHRTNAVARVRELRAVARAQVDRIEGAVERMEAARAAIAERQQELAASRARLEQREAALQAAQQERRAQLRELVGEERDLVEALSAPAPAADGGPITAPGPAPAPSGGSTATLNPDGTATAPADAPQPVKDAIAAANAISDMPYLYGGGHGSFESSGYDCSGAVSYALHGGGFLSSPLDSTGFMTWGESGPGSWITVYSNPGHAYVVIAGLRFDTSGGAGPRWQGPRDPAGFVATHPPGY